MEVEQQEETKIETTEEVQDNKEDQEFDEVEGGNDEDNKEDEKEDEEEEKKEIEQLMKEEDINIIPEDVNVNEIDKLTGNPKGNDIIECLVPMCAPYSAISSYKYKVKIQTGTLKRGKAQKLIKGLFLGQANKN